MNFNLNRFVVLSAAAVSMIVASGCSKKATNADELTSPLSPAMNASNGMDSDSGAAQGLVTVNFDYDSFALTGAEKEKLNANAGILKDKANIKIQIEGHCDTHGGIQYNLALGEKRAKAVKAFLVDKGINAKRITTISYGKERPLDVSGTEAADAKNRRGNFVVTSK